MTDPNNPYQGYANYQATRRSYSADEMGYPAQTGSFLRNPVLATIALLVGASILAGIILLATPDKNDEILPVIKADTEAFKHTPENPGGMAIPNSDSTVFSQMTDQESDLTPQPEAAENIPTEQRRSNKHVENLLAATTPEPNQPVPSRPAPAEQPKAAAMAAKIVQEVAEPDSAKLARVTPAPTNKPKDIPQKPERLHPAGSSPETLAFVRSVLNKEAANTKASAKPAPTAPAAQSGNLTHYVQLASIREQSRAEAQWANLQKKYSGILSGASHRVERKDLGAKGIYYRIQAGPYTKDTASSVCTKIKSITPSGCYLVAK